MLFYLDDSLTQCFNSPSLKKSLEVTLSYLDLAYKEGKHVIAGKRRLFKKLLRKAQEGVLINVNHDFLSYLQTHATELEQLNNQVFRYVRIVPEDEPQQEKDTKALYLALSFFQDSSFIQRTILLCENLLDTQLYLKMGEVYRSEEKMTRLKIQFKPMGGGGQETYRELENNVKGKEKRLCLCILDSDQHYPEGPVGGTFKKVKSLEESREKIFEIVKTRGMEIENSLSTKQLEELPFKSSEYLTAMGLLAWLDKNKLQEIRDYLDFKEGLTLEKIFSEPHLVRLYNKIFSSKYSHIPWNINSSCWDEKKCLKEKEKGDCTCVIMPGIGRKTLEPDLFPSTPLRELFHGEDL